MTPIQIQMVLTILQYVIQNIPAIAAECRMIYDDIVSSSDRPAITEAEQQEIDSRYVAAYDKLMGIVAK